MNSLTDGWRADCDDCSVTFPATPQGEAQLKRYVMAGPPDCDRCISMGGELAPCPKHAVAP